MNRVGVLLSAFVLGCTASPVPMPTDAGRTVSDAATVVDDDGDGVPADADCDDDDPAITGFSTTRCDNACGAGSIECYDGVRGACSSPTDCFCVPDATRSVPCGRCGMQPQRCGSDTLWADDGPCLYEGPCAPGWVDDDMSRCGHRRRLCSLDCEWLEWESIVPQGDCEPGERVPCRGGGHSTCGDHCRSFC